MSAVKTESNYNFLLKCMYYILLIFGLAPFSLSTNASKITALSLSRSVSIFLLLFISVILSMIMYGSYLWFLNDMNEEGSTLTSSIVLVTEISSNVFKSFCIYGKHFFNRNDFVKMINNGFRIQQCFIELNVVKKVSFLDNKCGHYLYAQCIASTIQVLMLIYFVITYKWSQRHQEKSSLWVVLMAYWPDWISLIVMNAYAGSMLVSWQFYRYLKNTLYNCMMKINDVTFMENRNQIKMQLFCDTSDDIDRLTKLYHDVYLFTQDIRKMFQIQVLYGLIDSFLIILSELFYIYIYSKDWFTSFSILNVLSEIQVSLGFVIFYIISLIFVVRISDSGMRELRNSGLLLDVIVPNIDIRLKQSMELLSIQILHQTCSITIFGMFPVNNALLFGIMGTFVTYLTILIQFDLAN